MLKEFKVEFDLLCDANSKLVSSGKLVLPMCVFLKKDGRPIVHYLNLRKDNKSEVLQDLKLIMSEKEMDAYMIIVPGEALIENKSDKKQSCNKCIVRSLYTKSEKITDLLWFKDSKILGRERILGKQGIDLWDLYTPRLIITINTDKKKQEQNTKTYKYKSKK